MWQPRASVIVACLLVLFAVPGRAEDEAKDPLFEVLVVGTFHAPWLFRSRHLHPGHVRAALEAAKPDVVGVESNPEWFAKGVFHDVTYEAQGIAVPWAKAREIPVYGIDWMDVAAWEAREEEREEQRAGALRRGGPRRDAFGQQLGVGLRRTRAFFEEIAREADFRRVNDIGANAYGEMWLAGAREGPVFGGHRNNQIVARCVEVMRSHPGKRLVVVIGAGHKAILDELFRRRPEVRLLGWEEDVPAPTAEEAEAALTLEDRVVILGHNLDGERSYFDALLIDLGRMEDVLAAYRKAGGDVSIARYFAARIATFHGENGTERWVELAEAAASRARLYPFPLDHWRMAYDLGQAARLELGRALLSARGTRAQAAEDLAALAAEMPEPQGTHGPLWRQAFLAKAFPRYLLEPTATRERAWTERWRGWDPTHGERPLSWDPEAEALLLRLTEPEGAGKPYLGLRTDVGSRSLVFSARVRATGVDKVTVVAYVWPDGAKATAIAQQVIQPMGEGWSEIILRLDVPEGLDRVGVNVYAERSADGRLWLADACVGPLR